MANQIPLVEYLALAPEPHLVAHECTACGAHFFDRRNACASCGGTEFRSADVATSGELRAYTIVSLAAPGIPVPFVAGVIDCDGTSVRANVINVEPDADHVHVGMKVRLATQLVGVDGAGTEAIGFGFEPMEERPMAEDVWILGIHMTKFGKHPDLDTVDLATEAAMGALADGDIAMRDMGILAAGNLMGASAPIGQMIQKQIGQTGIPVYNVSNACATGATALRTAIMAVKAGECDAGMAVGVEKLAGAGLLSGGARGKDSDTFEPRGRYGAVAPVDGRIGTETMPGVFAQIGMEYGHKYGGVDFELFAKISEKNHAHSTLNPLASYQKRFTLEEIMNDVMIAYPNTRPMCSANCDGAAAAVVVSDAKLRTLSREQQKRAVKVSASVLTTDPWEEACQILPNVNTLTKNAAKQAYEAAGIGPADLDLVELHDCFATAELVHYDNLGLCEEGGAADFFRSGATWRDGTTPVNVSGGLESKGHPIAATGIANIWEVCHHLRGEAGDRQIEGARVGLAHVIGLGSACGVHILERAA